MSDVIQLLVTVDLDQPIQEIANALTAEGLAISSVLKEVGSIVGTADKKHVASLRKVKGVMDVAPDFKVELDPPDSEVTW